MKDEQAKGTKVLKASVGYTVGNYLIKGLSFFTIPVFSRILSTSDYGYYNTFLAYENILFIFIGLAIHSSYKNARYRYKIIDEGAQYGKDYNTYVSTTLLFIIANTSLWLLIVNLFKKYVENVLRMDAGVINLLILYAMGTAILTCYNTDISLQYDYQKFLAISGFNAIVNISLSIALILSIFSENRYLGRIVGTVVPVLLISVYIIYIEIKKSKPAEFKIAKTFMHWGLKYSLPIVPHGLSQVVLNQFDRIMITQMVGKSETGIYCFAYNIYTIIAVTFTSLDNVWSPWFYEKRNSGRYSEIRKTSALYILFMFMLCSALMLVSPEIVMLLGGKEYWDAKYCVIPIVAGGFFSFMYTIPASVEYYHEKTSFIAMGTVMAAIINIITNYIFINRFGYIAAAYTTFATYVLYFTFHFLLAKKIEGKNIFSTKTILVSGVGIVLFALFSIATIKLWLLRWLLAIIIGVIMVAIEERYFSIVKKTLAKWQNKGKR